MTYNFFFYSFSRKYQNSDNKEVLEKETCRRICSDTINCGTVTSHGATTPGTLSVTVFMSTLSMLGGHALPVSTPKVFSVPSPISDRAIPGVIPTTNENPATTSGLSFSFYSKF